MGNVNNLNLEIKTRKDLRNWFEMNHNVEKEIWISLKFGQPDDENNLYYLDAVEEALCFGWIDTTKKKYNDEITIQKFMPRKRNSNWTELNKERCKRLCSFGLMHEIGIKKYQESLKNEFKIDDEILETIKKDQQVYKNFINFPELYVRIKIDNIQSYKKDKKLYETRLNKFIENTKENILYGQWNDYGRLINYQK